MKVNNCEEKPPLETDPFIKFFEYGNADGREGCGHDCMRSDAFNVNSMNVGFGGKSASMMHSSKITEVDGYLGN
eukprot:4196055-Ditylum_brightwellii.AAC.1